jgi:hypothetical protein
VLAAEVPHEQPAGVLGADGAAEHGLEFLAGDVLGAVEEFVREVDGGLA